MKRPSILVILLLAMPYTYAENWLYLEEISASLSVPIPPPILLSPENRSNLNDNSPLLVWESIKPADNFHIQLDEDENFSSPLDLFCSSCSLELPPLGEGVYFWRVRAFRSYSASEWSTVFSFRVDISPPSPPLLLQPTDGESFVNSVPLLTWQSPIENSLPLSFLVQLDDNPDFSHPTSTWVWEENWLPPSLGQDNYYWRVKARDNAGNEGEWSETRRFEILDTIPPSPPSPLFPLAYENLNDNTPLLRWAPPQENSLPLTYCIQVSPDRYQIFASAWTDNENWECSSVLSDGLWYWRVCARDNAGNTGLFFDWTPFTVDTVNPSPPPLLSPAAGAEIDGTSVTFEWGDGSDDKTGIQGYIIQLSADPSFLQLEKEQFVTQHQFSYTLPKLGEWYWRVGSVDGAGNIGWSDGRVFICRGWRALDLITDIVLACADWNPLEEVHISTCTIQGQWREIEIFSLEVRAFPDWISMQCWNCKIWGGVYWRFAEQLGGGLSSPVPAPIPFLPENGIHVSKVRLCWENSKAADNFEIQTDIPSKFWRPFRFTYLTWFSTENFLDLPLDNLQDGNYIWRVRAWRSGSCSPWSEVYTFVLDRHVTTPLPLSPDNGCNIGRNLVTFTWNQVEDVTPPVEYEVQVSADSDFKSYLSSGWLAWRIWDLELPEGVYFWRIRAKDNLGNLSEFSSSRCLRVDLTPPAAPRLVYPPSGSWLTSTPVILSWEEVKDNSSPVVYMVLVDDAPDFSSPNLVVQTVSNSITVSSIADGTWYWRVIATDNAGNRSPPSTSFFSLDTTAPPIPAQVLPPSTLLTSGKVKFEWSNVWDLNQVYYDLLIEGVLEKENLKENQYQITLPPGIYKWRVRARDNLGNTRGWSAFSSFEIRDVKPPSLLLLEPLAQNVEEDFMLRVRVTDDFGLDEKNTKVKIDRQEKGFTLTENFLVCEFKKVPAGKHLVEISVVDVGGNENRLSIELTVLPRVSVEIHIRKEREKVVVNLHLKNCSKAQITKHYTLVLAGYARELEVPLNPNQETVVSVEFGGIELKEYVVELIDLDTEFKTCASMKVSEGFPFLVLFPIGLGTTLGLGLLLRKPRSTSVPETSEEEKFPLPLPPPQKEPDDYSLLASLFRPDMQVEFTKEWSRLTKRYGTELSPIMEEYARLLSEGPKLSLIEKYRKLLRGRGD
jgi:hypothetical protein